MSNNQARDLFQLQSQLIEGKVDMAVGKAIERVMDELASLRGDMLSIKHGFHVDMHALKRDMDKQFSTLGERVIAVESTLTFIKDTQREISNKFIQYTFKAGWLMLFAAVSYSIVHAFGLVG